MSEEKRTRSWKRSWIPKSWTPSAAVGCLAEEGIVKPLLLKKTKY